MHRTELKTTEESILEGSAIEIILSTHTPTSRISPEGRMEHASPLAWAGATRTWVARLFLLRHAGN